MCAIASCAPPPAPPAAVPRCPPSTYSKSDAAAPSPLQILLYPTQLFSLSTVISVFGVCPASSKKAAVPVSLLRRRRVDAAWSHESRPRGVGPPPGGAAACCALITCVVVDMCQEEPAAALFC